MCNTGFSNYIAANMLKTVSMSGLVTAYSASDNVSPAVAYA